MAILKVLEFAEKYGIKRTNVYTYQKRKKLIIVDGYVDEENPINKIFIDSRKISSKVEKPVHITNIPVDNTYNDITKDSQQKTKRITKAVNEPLYLEFQQTNKVKDEKLQEEVRQIKLRNDKIEGRLIPVDIVKKILGEIVLQYKTTYGQQVEQLLRDSLNELQASNEQITYACSKLTDIANKSTEQGINEIKINLKNISNN